jgi:hypothetical protein
LNRAKAVFDVSAAVAAVAASVSTIIVVSEGAACNEFEIVDAVAGFEEDEKELKTRTFIA